MDFEALGATMLNQFHKVLRTAAMGAFVALGASGSAQATLVVGVFDPLFGASLPGVNFNGEATFNISQNCLNLPLADAQGVFVYASNNCGGSNPSQMSFLGAEVDFTDGMGHALGQVTFSVGTIIGMFVQNHTVVGVQSALIGPATVVGGSLAGDQFELVFGDTNPKIDPNEGLIPGRGDGDGDYDDKSASFFQTTHLILVGGPGCNAQGVRCPSTSQGATTTFAVPEPGSLSLALGALGVGWLVRRKKPGAVVAHAA